MFMKGNLISNSRSEEILYTDWSFFPVGSRNDSHKTVITCLFGATGKKERKSDCGEWQWSVCVANEGDCGLGTREGTRTGTDCKQTIKTQRCKIPCNWKKKFGGKRAPFIPWLQFFSVERRVYPKGSPTFTQTTVLFHSRNQKAA